MLQVLIFEVVAIIYQCFNGLFDEKIIMERSGTICATIKTPKILQEEEELNLTITNWRLLWSLYMKPPRILGGHSKKIEKIYKFSQKSETSSHSSDYSNHNSHWICDLF